jgi:uncharacterized protein YwqG
MAREEVIKRLERWRVKYRRTAWTPIAAEGSDSTTASKFCGIPWIGPEDPWPECGICGQPLTPFLQLNLGDVPEELGNQFGTGLLQLFYCTREDCQGSGGWQPFADDLSRVRVVHPKLPATTASPLRIAHLPAKQIVGWRSSQDLPTPCEHEELGLKYTYDFGAGTLRLECPEFDLDLTYPLNDCPAEEIATSMPGDKLGGWPSWVQGVEYPECPQCGRRMIHVFQLDSDDNIPFMFGDVGCGHITQCPEHKEIVAFGWACS